MSYLRALAAERGVKDHQNVGTIARVARDLLDVYEREPALFHRVMSTLTAEDIETLRELATWDSPALHRVALSSR
jgi:hypothetical protein